ncbi:hypothetical protein GCM10027566_29340 [Arachidicoccus ginsenosidivorans]|jgi:hypothetical protein
MYVPLTPIINKKKVYKKYLISIKRHKEHPWHSPSPFILAFLVSFILERNRAGVVLRESS